MIRVWRIVPTVRGKGLGAEKTVRFYYASAQIQDTAAPRQYKVRPEPILLPNYVTQTPLPSLGYRLTVILIFQWIQVH